MDRIALSGYEHSMDILRMKLNEMFSLSLESFDSSIKSLENVDVKIAEMVIKQDDEIDALKREIEEIVYEILLKYKPLSQDLRRIIMAMKITGELERIADQGVNIAQVTQFLEGKTLIKPLIDIPKMAQVAREMLHGAMKAYFDENIELAKKIWLMDDQVDELDRKVVNDLEEIVEKHCSRDRIAQAERLILVSRAIERVADHSTNICEETTYMILGKELYTLLGGER
ncbi:MAG: phosphate transport system regulatory protein PhoU [Mesoaciditoga sp.]|uniref:phosphate signaling complex protein PhoU n=1 Tax=Athalassotoga sp. TaxID=2022597 RepID=UPI000CC4E4BA|nr:MAG: phosphate transport system regulatory protein PhoU [Mesoaciditoga sp.]PMP70621.1 MAG: phosphate transport system regulatory protein PhoU [Mesoaciditoga sp.]PMP78561.1 MAG: phosphate transport system regulatory protein PhoU [Mesoaciditoga sp.]PMP79015.1 MAG: phosphate transport system regulatory protein PhoU [Mesoaciditoga sp.]HEU24417.1 phosphate signaling complex protein PhoU [Mesoaciditoga lauensis]